ncbi:MAG: hypothetical protein NTX49_04205 [Chlamydiae bacterium]|nr:hypothetical protein [Chlamydiota bacterium]
MEGNGKIEVKRKLSQLGDSLLPMLAPFFLQVASASFLLKSLPLPVALGSAIGLLISYLFGPIGFFISAASWGTYLAVEQPELLKSHLHLLFIGSCVISWWLSTLCSEQYQQKVVDFEEMISSLFKKNIDLEKRGQDAQLVIKEEKKEKDRLAADLDSQVQDLQQQLSSHRHHLSIAWQETSMLKEEGEKQKKQSQADYESAETQAMFYLQDCKRAEGSLEDLKKQMQALLAEKEEKQNQFLEEITQLHLKIEQMQKDRERQGKEFSEARADLQAQESENIAKACQEVKTEIERELSVEVIALQSNIEEIQKEKDLKEAQIASLLSQISSLEVEKVALVEKTPSESLPTEVGDSEQVMYWENQYKQLRIQFDEKSEVLTDARRELFTLENQLLVLKSEESDLAHVENEEQIQLISHLQNLDEECSDLQEQVDLLQEIVSSLQEKKKATRLKTSKSSSVMDMLLEESSKKVEESFSN